MTHEFSCCSFYAKCNYGNNDCYFEETQPEKKERCRCYQIKHSAPRKTTGISESYTEAETNREESLEQLSLF